MAGASVRAAEEAVAAARAHEKTRARLVAEIEGRHRRRLDAVATARAQLLDLEADAADVANQLEWARQEARLAADAVRGAGEDLAREYARLERLGCQAAPYRQ